MSKSIIPREKIFCLSNGTTNAIRYYLRTTSFTPERFTGQDVLSLTNKFLKQDPKSKAQAHILYFLHLDLQEVEKIKPTPGYFSLVNVDYDPIVPSYYISAVFYIRLHEYFLQMVNTLGPHMQFARNLLSMAVDRIVGSNEQLLQERLSDKEWLLYLTTTAQLLRINPQDVFYNETFQKLLKTFIDLPYELMPAFARADVLLRLAGIISLTNMDYEGSSEIGDSIKELKFDPFSRSSSSSSSDGGSVRTDNTTEAFQSMFGCEKVDCTTFPQLQDVVKLIGIYINELQLTEGEKDSLRRLDDLPKKLQKAIHYIGDCAYLTTLIVKKNLPNLYPPTTMADTTSLLYFTAYMEQFKSKIRCEDYDTRNMKFAEFSNFLRSAKLKYAHHQTSWFERFLNYEESLTTPEGYSLAKDVIVPRVDLQIGLQIIKKILRIYSSTTPLDEELKEILLALVIANDNLHKEFDQIVNLLMKKEIHTGFCTTGFQSQLNDVSSKLGADSSFDKITHRLSINCIRECQRLALQNPKVACQTLLLRTMQLPKGGVEILEALRCFWNLPFTTHLDQAGCVSNLFDYSLKEICIQVTDDTMRNMQTKLAKFVPHLLRNNFITTEKFAAIVHSMIVSFNNTECNEKIGLLIDIYGSLVNFVISEEHLSTAAKIGTTKNPSQEQFIQEAYYRLYGLSRVAIWSKAMDIYAVRDKCLEICDNLKKFRPSLIKPDPESDSKMMQLFDDISLVNKILVYVRKSESRHVFQELLKTGKFVAQHDVAPTSKDLANCIRNTSPTEWDDLIEILYEVFLQLSRNLINAGSNNIHDGGGDKKLDDYRELAFQQLFAVLKKVPAFELPSVEDDADCVDDDQRTSNKPTSSRHSRNPVPSVIYQRFAHHLVYAIARGHSAFADFSLRHQDQYDLVYSFVSLIANYPDDREYTHVKQLTFISLLDLATWIVKYNPDYETKLKDRILECFEEVRDEEDKGKHGSIAKSIITVFKLTEPQAQSIIPVERAEAAGDGETDETDQEIRLRFLNEDALRINQMTQEDQQGTSSSTTTDEQYPFKDPLTFYRSVKMKVLTMAEGRK